MSEEKFDTISASDFELLKQQLSEVGEIEAQVMSGSMEPVLMTGQKIRILSLEKLGRPIRRFDILAFHSGHRKIITVHYLWHRNQAFGDLIVTRSLVTHAEDQPISSKDVLGVVEPGLPVRWKMWITLRHWLKS